MAEKDSPILTVKDEKPYVQTYTIVAGSLACNARCPYCVSKMTPTQGVENKLPEVNWRNFDLGARLSREWGAATVLITSKGESTLYPEQITQYMNQLEKHGFSMIEIQTNGIKLMEDSYDPHLRDWYDKGMTTIALSIAHYDSKKNKEIFEPHNNNLLDLEKLIGKLHDHKFSVRLSCIMLKNYIDSIEKVSELVDFSRENKVEQLTVRPVSRPSVSENAEVARFVDEHVPDHNLMTELRDHFDREAQELRAKRVRQLVHGAIVYSVRGKDKQKGQNLCISNCLTIRPDDTAIRQLIFFPDGHVRYDWEHEGAIFF